MTVYFKFESDDAYVLANTSPQERATATWQTGDYRYTFHSGHDLGNPLYMEPAGGCTQPYPKIDTKGKTAHNFVLVNSGKLSGGDRADVQSVVRSNWDIFQRLARNFHEGVDDGKSRSYYVCTTCGKKYGPAPSGLSLPNIGAIVGTYPPLCSKSNNRGECRGLIVEQKIG